MNTDAEAQVRAMLTAHAPLTAIVGDRIAVNAVPEGSGYPCVVFAVRVESQLTLSGDLDELEGHASIQCWADAPLAARALADHVRDAVDAVDPQYGAVVQSEMTIFDAELGLDGVQLEVQWWPG